MFRGGAPRNQYVKSYDDSIKLSDLVSLIQMSDCIILYSDWCRYSQNALSLLNKKRVPHTSIEIDKIDASMDEIRSKIAKANIKGFDGSHSTRPMIFMGGKFIGGFTELEKLLSKK